MIDEDPYGAIFGRRTSTPNDEKATKPTATPGKHDVHGSNQRSGNAGVNACETKPVRDPTNTMKTSTDRTHPSEERFPRSSNSDEFTIDPITMRKIFKTQPPPPPQEIDTKEEFGSHIKSFNIPVKTYRAPEQASPTTRSNENVHPTIRKLEREGQDWLAQEGFGAPPQSVESAKARASRVPPKIESALDRHLRKEKGAEGNKRKDTVAPIYHTAENRTEDIDLLTASGIRASAGRVSKPSKTTPKEKQDRRETLENDYRRRSENLEKRLEAEVAANKEQSIQKLTQELQDRRRDAARSAHEQEIKEQKFAMETHEARIPNAKQSDAATAGPNLQPGEGDMALNVHDFVSRDRWYKQKAPHASTEAEHKLRQANKDRAFVREIRGIYEDKYGIIDTKHRQEPKKQPTVVSDYPGDAYPGTLYEQPWSANVLNDHPENDSQGSVPNQQSKPQGHHEQQEFQALSLIGRLFGELRENQALLQDNQVELRKIPTKDETMNLFQSLKAHEQRVMHMLKAAQTLIKGAAAETGHAQVGVSSDTSLAQNQEPASTTTTSGEEDPSPDVSRHLSSTIYKILAYDPSTQRVLTTKTSTWTGSLTEKPLSLSEALSGLENPARFLPHFAALQKAQYELATGGSNFLVFKKARQAQPQTELEDAQAELIEPSNSIPLRYANPIDGTTPQIGNFASPTGFVNYDPPFPMEEALKDPPPVPRVNGLRSKPRDKVRRQEDVFSGSSRRAWHDHHEHNRMKPKSKHRRSIRRRKTFARMFLVGLLTAAGCYTIGVASEFLRM